MLKFVVNRATNKSNQFSIHHQHSSRNDPNFTLIEVSSNKKHHTPSSYIVNDSRTLTSLLNATDKKTAVQKPAAQNPKFSADENGCGPIEATTWTPAPPQNGGSQREAGRSSSGGGRNGDSLPPQLRQYQQQQRMVHLHHNIGQQNRQDHHNQKKCGQQNRSLKFDASSASPSASSACPASYQRHSTVPLNNDNNNPAAANPTNNRKQSPAPRPRISKAAASTTDRLSSFPVVVVPSPHHETTTGLNTKTIATVVNSNNNNNNRQDVNGITVADVNGITIDAKDLALLMQMNGFRNNNNNNNSKSSNNNNKGSGPRVVVINSNSDSNKNEQKPPQNTNSGQFDDFNYQYDIQKHSISRGIDSTGVTALTRSNNGYQTNGHHTRSLSVSNPIKTMYTQNMLKNSQNSFSSPGNNGSKIDNRYVDAIDFTNNFVRGDSHNDNNANRRPKVDVGMLISRKQQQIDINTHRKQISSAASTPAKLSKSNKNGTKSGHSHYHLHHGSAGAAGVSRSLSRTTAFTVTAATLSSDTAAIDGYEKAISSPRSGGHPHTISNAGGGVVLNGFGHGTGNISGHGGGLATAAAVRHRPGLNGLIYGGGSAAASTSFALSNQQQHNHPTTLMTTMTMNPLINSYNSKHQSSLLTSNNKKNSGSKGMFHTYSSSSSSTSTTSTSTSPPSPSSGHSPPPYTSGVEDSLIQIRIRPDPQGRFGFNVKGGSDQNHAIIVSRVVPGSPADQCFPRLNEGDQVLLINGRDVAPLTHEQVVRYIRSARGSSSPHKQLHLSVRPNAYMGEDMDESVRSESPGVHQQFGIKNREKYKGGIAQQLYRKKPGMSMDICKATENLAKNRYRDVLPYDATRVVLRKSTTGDYINANFMEIPTSGIVNRYIAGQGPLPHTAGDFWTAVWEQLCTTVVMLTDTVERFIPAFSYSLFRTDLAYFASLPTICSH